jgi:hypothetical protein
MTKRKLTPIQSRRQQIEKQLEKLNAEVRTRKRKDFRTDEGFAEWQVRLPEKIRRLEEESVMLTYPEEYGELPLALVAEELGLQTSDVQHLIKLQELEASDDNRDRIGRDEFERALDVGAEELMRRANRLADEILAEGIAHLQKGDTSAVEDILELLDVRQAWDEELVLEIAKDLAAGNLENAARAFRSMVSYRSESTAITMACVSRALSGLKLIDHGAQAMLERMLAIAEGANDDPYQFRSGLGSKVIGKHLDRTQQQAMYLAAAVQGSLGRYRQVQSFRTYNDRTSEMRKEEFEAVIRNAIYTALHAENTYNESAASKLYVDSINASIPRWWAPAEMLEVLRVGKNQTAS